MKRILLTLSAIVLASCAGNETPITEDNNQIQTPHYSFVIPPGQGWSLAPRTGLPGEEVISLIKRVGPFTYLIDTKRTDVPKEFQTWPVKQVADSYRSANLQNMELQGPEKGLAFRDVAFGEEELEGRRFFTMAYTSVSTTQKGLLKVLVYLLFPKEENNEWFLFTHFAEGGSSGDIVANSRKGEFFQILKSVSVRP